MAAASLRRNVGWAFAGSLVLSLSQWGILIAIAKVAGAAAVGDWNLAIAVTGPIFVLGLLKLRQLQASDVRHEHGWGTYAALRLVCMAIAFVASASIALVGFNDATAVAIIGVAAMKVFDGGSDLAYGQLQRDEHMDRLARSQIGRGASALLIAVPVFMATRSVMILALTTAAVYGVWLVYDLRQVRRVLDDEPLRPSWDGAGLRKVFRQAIPLGLVTAIGSLQLNVPRYFLEGYVGRAELGVFSSMAQLMFLGALVVAAIANAALPRLARHARDEEWAEFSRLLVRLLLSGAALGVLAVLTSLAIGGPVLELLYSAEFATHATTLVWLAAASGLLWSYVFLGTALDAMRSFRVQPWIYGASTIAISIASALLIPPYGLPGAAWALLVGYGVECALFVIAVARPLRRAIRKAVR